MWNLTLLTEFCADGLRSPRPRSTSRVRFDLGSNIAHSPDASRRKDDAKRSDPASERHSDTETEGDRKHRSRRHRRKGKERERDRDDDHRKRDSMGLMHDKYDRDSDSEGTIDLPERFDKNGNPKPEDPLAAKINDLLSGHGGGGGNIFKTLAEGFLGGQAGGGSTNDGDDDEESSRRRRHSRR